MDVLVLNARFLVTVDEGRRIIKDGALAIDRGRVVDVGKTDQVRTRHPSADRTIDARNFVVMPGMMNCHCHTTEQLSRGLQDNVGLATRVSERALQFEGGIGPDEAYLSALACFMECIKNGVTTLADPGGPYMNKVVQALDEVGARAFLAERLADIPHRGGGRTSDAAGGLTEKALRTGEEFFKNYDGAARGRARVWFSVRTERTTSNELGARVKQLADRYGVGIQTHMGNSLDAIARHKEMFGGELPLKRYHDIGLLGPNLLLAHCNWMTDEERELLVRSGASVCATPTSNIAVGSGGLKWGNTEKMISEGVNVALGCSGSQASNFLDMIRVGYCLSGAQDVQCDPTLYPPERLLEMLTINAAKALLSKTEIGSLEVGKKADVVLVDTRRPEWVPLFNPVSNLVLSSSGDAVDTVIVDGKVVMEGRRMRTVDELDVLEKAQSAAEGIAERTGSAGFGRPRWKVS